MSIFKQLVSLGRSEIGHMTSGSYRMKGNSKDYVGRFNNDGSVDGRFDKTPNQAESLNQRDKKK